MQPRPKAASARSRADCGSQRTSRGLTIAEFLAALLVIAVGIIGVAALYSDEVQTDRTTHLRARAAELAEVIAARIRTDAAGRPGYAATVGVICKPGERPQNPIAAASHEAACWENEVEAQLPSGTGNVTRDATTTPLSYVIAVSWSEENRGAASYVLRVQPDGDPAESSPTRGRGQ